MKNLPATNTKAINDYRRRLAQTLDNIGQMRLRAEIAEGYGLYAVAERARATIARFEVDVSRYQQALSKLGAE